MLISYDSVSRSSWLKRLPKTNKFIFDKMKFDLLNGYNIVGDGTPAALIPIFTGQTEEELPNVLRSNPKARYVDEAYPFIWKELHDKGYMSMYLDDWPHISAFSYRMKGFLNHTCHHYYKHYQLKLWEIVSYDYFDAKGIKDDSCIGTKKRHKVLLDLLHDFKKEYKNLTNNIAIMHYVENSHDTNEKFNCVDNDLYTFLSKSYNDGLFDNTAIFLYSDHGLRFSDKRNNSNTRYLEERLPFFSVYLPNEYKLNNKAKYNNLKLNTKLLTSPFVYSKSIESYEFKSNTFSIRSKNDISRIDSYGEQPRCVSNLTSASNPNENLDLRKFCFCYKKRLRKKKLNATHVILY